jgi:hypothetical protein
MAEKYISANVKISYKYSTSLKNTYNADKINPVPIIKMNKQIIGYSNIINFQVNAIFSNATNMKKITNVKIKLIDAAITLEIKNKYLGTVTFVIIPALEIIEDIPLLVASLK